MSEFFLPSPLLFLLARINEITRFIYARRNELDDLAEEIGEVNQELRRSLRSIVNSIRDLLTSFDTDGNRRSNSTGETSRETEATIDGDAEDSETSETDERNF